MPVLDLLSQFTDVPLGPLAAAMALTMIAAALQGTVGFGFGLVAVPTLAMLDPRLSPVPQLMLALPLTLRMGWSERSAIDWSGVVPILIGRLPGAALGVWLVSRFDRPGLELLIAAIIAVAVLLAIAGNRAGGEPRPASNALRVTVGVVSGATGYVAAISGPPVALIYRNARGSMLRATLATIFLAGLSITLTTRTVAGHISLGDVKVALVLVPFVFLGLWVSRWLKPRVEGPFLRNAVLVLAAASALALALRTLLG